MIMNRKPFLLSALVAGSVMTASAVLMLPEPKLTGEHVSDGKVRITWEFSSEDAPDPYFQVVVYKMHKAAAEENFVLAETDFGYIESEGTMKKHQDRGAIWDCLPDCPGWYVKFPLYMNGALGIDAFQYFPGSDNDDIFGGAYLISPDYDLSNVRDNSVKIEASLGREASSVTGGFCLWTFNTDWWDDKNIDYKPIREHDHHYETLDNEQFNPFAETCQADEYMERTRVMFYGKGRSAYWIDSFRVSADMAPGDSIAYGASLHRVDGQTEFTIDTSADTENDYTYGYEVRAIREDHREHVHALHQPVAPDESDRQGAGPRARRKRHRHDSRRRGRSPRGILHAAGNTRGRARERGDSDRPQRKQVLQDHNALTP